LQDKPDGMLPQENMGIETDDTTVEAAAGLCDGDDARDERRATGSLASDSAPLDAGERRIGERRAGERRAAGRRSSGQETDSDAQDAAESGSRIERLEAQVQRQAELLEMVSDPEALKRRVELQHEVEKLEARLKRARKQKKEAEREADTALQEARSLRTRQTTAKSTIDKLLDDDTSPGRIKAALRDLFTDGTV